MQSQFSLEKKHTRFLTPWGPPDTGQSAIIKWGGGILGMGMGGQQMMLGRSWEGKQKVWDRWSIPLRIVSQALGSFWIHVGLTVRFTLDSSWNHFGIILDHVWIVWGSFGDRVGIILGSFWGHPGIILGVQTNQELSGSCVQVFSMSLLLTCTCVKHELYRRLILYRPLWS